MIYSKCLHWNSKCLIAIILKYIWNHISTWFKIPKILDQKFYYIILVIYIYIYNFRKQLFLVLLRGHRKKVFISISRICFTSVFIPEFILHFYITYLISLLYWSVFKAEIQMFTHLLLSQEPYLSVQLLKSLQAPLWMRIASQCQDKVNIHVTSCPFWTTIFISSLVEITVLALRGETLKLFSSC